MPSRPSETVEKLLVAIEQRSPKSPVWAEVRALLRAVVREHAAMRRLWEGGLSPAAPEERVMREMDRAVAALLGEKE